jgi:hypothetical protein
MSAGAARSEPDRLGERRRGAIRVAVRRFSPQPGAAVLRRRCRALAGTMSLIALATWITTAGGGLYLLSIWLIEYDKDFQSVAATRLPPAVLTAHVLLALGGLFIWIGYVIVGQDRLAWIALGAMLLAATLGVFMATRWVGVYRATREIRRNLAEQKAGRLTLAGDSPGVATLEVVRDIGPPERNFPLPVVIAHGAFAAATITLVLLTVLGVFGS